MFQSDLEISTSLFSHLYSSSLNSADKLDIDIALRTSRAFGGTLTLWKRTLDPFVKVLDVNSDSINVIIMTIPGYPTTVHINIYLPTAGRDADYISELSKLENILEEIDDEYNKPIVVIRGDANASIPARQSNSRDTLFQYFCERMNLHPILTHHKTYHHFMGDGASDSSIDVILLRHFPAGASENIENIICSKEDPRVDSKHDIVVSKLTLPFIGFPKLPTIEQPPSIPNTKHKIIWSEEGILAYRELLETTLTNLQNNWKNPDSPVSFSVLLQCTNEALIGAAKLTNRTIDLTKDKPPRPVHKPHEVLVAEKDKLEAHIKMKAILPNPISTIPEKASAQADFRAARVAHRRVYRRHQAVQEHDRDQKLSAIMSENPSVAFKHLRSVRSTSNSKISDIVVDGEVFSGNHVATGFYHNIKNLKTVDNCTSCEAFKFDYKLIREICKAGEKIPPLSIIEAEKLLHSMKPSVCDHWSISANHYINGGPIALKHFQELVNLALRDIENTSVDEMNVARACILFKGHQKNKNLASSYRTISTCPFISKACDTYIRNLSLDDWHNARADVQFLGPGMSHEMGALLLSEVIHHSLNIRDKPVFALFLDARSAFDRTIREILVRKLFLLGTTGNRLLYFDNRLKHRKTFCEWDHQVLGPIHDKQGVEQGGVPSGDLYTIYNNEQFDCAQESGLGVPLHDQEVASIGQADDCVLLADNIFSLKNILTLSLDYCNKYHVKLAPEKTKLLAFTAPRHKKIFEFTKIVSQIKIENTEINFSETAEHVGIVRSSSSNQPHILDRIAAHRKSLFAVLPAGLARRHNANQAAALSVHKTFSLPVLLSGIACLSLTTADHNILDKHFKSTLRRLLKLPDKTPDPVIYFLAGTTPIRAHIHRRQLSLFGMITRLPNNILHKTATTILLSSSDNSKSWFIGIRQLCDQYSLPYPLLLLKNPPTKHSFNKLVKSRILDYWEKHLRSVAASKSSLEYFKPSFMSLTSPHQMFITCSSNSFETNKSTCQASLISGRYKTDYLARHWVKENPSGYCVLCPGLDTPDTLDHFVLFCEALTPARTNVLNHWQLYSCKDDQLRNLLLNKLHSSTKTLMQFLIDPSVDSDVIRGVQNNLIKLEEVYRLTRTWCYAVHRKKLQMTGRFRKL